MRDRIENFFGRWWRVLVSFASLAVIATMAFVTLSVAGEASEERRAREIAEERNAQLADIIEAEQEDRATRDQRLATAVGQVRAVLVEEIAKHDAQINRLIARQLDELDRLLNRPVGTTPGPVTTRRSAPSPSAPPSASPPSPTPTMPDQKNCAKRPNGPRC